MARCLLGLGSNVGDRVGNILSAIGALEVHSQIAVRALSSLVETAPVGGPPGQDRFFNAAAIVETSLGPTELLDELLAVERQLGRTRGVRWGPREIDLDVLLYGEQIFAEPHLAIPHPLLHERRFALFPAAEIAADWRHPALQKSIGDLLHDLPAEGKAEVGLRVITQPLAMQREVAALRREGRRVGLVPTMGALHAGHLSLVRAARERTDVAVTTIFVNPTQFGPREDLERYPRTLESDLQALAKEQCDLVFVPEAAALYPPGFSTYVEPPAVAHSLEGAFRPGHFRGVATIVLKLFHVVPADVACFGEKDYQQLQVVRHLVRDLNVPIEIVACPTLREPDGLAMSSRNRYLSPAERQQALGLARALARGAELASAGERRGSQIVAEMRRILNSAGIERIDYVAVADPESLTEQLTLEGPAIALIAAHVGSTRLIDNRLLLPGLSRNRAQDARGASS